MCFSAGASFGASAILGAVGAVAISKAKTNQGRVFATTPLLFAIQQLAEGMIWLSLKNPDLEPYQPLFMYIFLFFAIMVWPAWVPLTIRALETDPSRKKVLNVLVSTGITIAAGIGFVLMYYPVQVMNTDHHLHYMFGFPPETKSFIWLFTVLYIMATIISPFISGIKRMKWLGIIFLVSYLFSVIFFQGFVVSVWCYFAALLSIIVVWILAGIKTENSDTRFQRFFKGSV